MVHRVLNPERSNPEGRLSKGTYVSRVKKDWMTWVPILAGLIRYDDADRYTADQLREMNVALELWSKEQNKGRGVKGR